ncbi:hypothetical protein J2S53_002875 [Actinopolyspora lacussalsi]|nr:hypothetical protein [Actinopolyspora lacussalsi]
MLVQVHPASLNAWSAGEANAGRSKLKRNLKRGEDAPKKGTGPLLNLPHFTPYESTANVHCSAL